MCPHRGIRGLNHIPTSTHKEDTIAEAADIQLQALALKQLSAALDALIVKAKLTGLWLDGKEPTLPRRGMSSAAGRCRTSNGSRNTSRPIERGRGAGKCHMSTAA